MSNVNNCLIIKYMYCVHTIKQIIAIVYFSSIIIHHLILLFYPTNFICIVLFQYMCYKCHNDKINNPIIN